MYKLASRSSHTASLFYRVIMAIAPGLCGEVRDNIIFSARLTRQCSVLTENFVFEHLESHSCADFYETMGTNSQLGVGSYGSVYSCRCKRTGEIFACKVAFCMSHDECVLVLFALGYWIKSYKCTLSSEAPLRDCNNEGIVLYSVYALECI